jgi:hypothetical protein
MTYEEPRPRRNTPGRKWPLRTRSSVSACAMLTATACVLSPAAPNEGQLGSDSFFYECTEPSDAACDLLSNPMPLDKLPVIALGATFGIVVQPLGHTVTSPTPFLGESSVGPTGSVFIAMREGEAVIVSLQSSVSSTDLQASDLTHLQIRKPMTLALSVGDVATGFTTFASAAGIKMTAGSTQRVRVVPQDVNSGALAGALPCQWATSNAASISLSTDPTDNVVTVTASGAGTSMLTATLGDLTTSFQITVGP